VDTTAQTGFAGALARWRAIVERRVDDAGELAANMEALYRAVFETDFGQLDVAEVKAVAETARHDLFDLYLAVRDRIGAWRARGLMVGDAPDAVRHALRVLRYTIDIVAEVANGHARVTAGEGPVIAFGGPANWTAMHPALHYGAGAVPQAGDLLLVRGQLHNSAAIARIGDVDGQFSHVGIVHIDGQGERWLVEALIEEGAVLTPLGEALSHGLVRAALLRHRDGALAQKAAQFAAERVARGRRGLFGWIPYDFTMELDGDDRFFCSKLVGYGYARASGGALSMPGFPTRLSMKNRDFFERIGVTARETFAPSDLELEPAFDWVAEWRDLRLTSAVRMQDLLMSKLFDWMDQHGYVFREGIGIALLALLGRMSSVWPGFAKDALVRLGFAKVPLNMPVRTITTIGMLHQTAQPILERLIELDEQRISHAGRPLHPREVQAELERYRAACGGRLGYLAIP
jgi:hypothetical protein